MHYGSDRATYRVPVRVSQQVMGFKARQVLLFDAVHVLGE